MASKKKNETKFDVDAAKIPRQRHAAKLSDIRWAPDSSLLVCGTVVTEAPEVVRLYRSAKVCLASVRLSAGMHVWVVNASGEDYVKLMRLLAPVSAGEKLKEAYMALNPDVTVEVQQNDSTTGMTSTIDGAYDIGMASRELKDSELEAGLTPTVIAQDGIAVIVNKENTLTGLTSEQVLRIYTGETTDWSELQ